MIFALRLEFEISCDFNWILAIDPCMLLRMRYPIKNIRFAHVFSGMTILVTV